MTQLRIGTPEEAGMDSKRIELIRQRGAEWARQDNTMGLVLVAARHGIVCLHEAFGQVRPGPDAPPVTTDSLFWYASITKSMVAVACMILVQEGRLSLTRPARFYIPELQASGTENLLVQHLLSHTSGYDGDQTPVRVEALMQSEMRVPRRPPGQHPWMHKRMTALYQVSPDRPPGSRMSYAHENFELLGEIIWRVSGLRWPDFVTQRIFQPIGMTRSTAYYDDSLEANLVWDFSNEVLPGITHDVARGMFRTPLAAGGTFGTALDCAAFAQMLLNGGHYGDARLLHLACVRQMARNQVPGIGTDFGGWHEEASWGFGVDMIERERWRWFDGSLPANGSFCHGGAGGTLFWVDPSRDVVGVYFSHCLDIDPTTGEGHWDLDLFQNLVTAAVVN